MFYFFGFKVHDHHCGLSHFHCDKYGVVNSFFVHLSNEHSVHHHFDVVYLVAIQFHAFDDFLDFTIHTNLCVSISENLFKKFSVVSFSSFYFWSQKRHLSPLKIVFNTLTNGIVGIFHHWFTRDIGVGGTNPRKQQTKEVV